MGRFAGDGTDGQNIHACRSLTVPQRRHGSRHHSAVGVGFAEVETQARICRRSGYQLRTETVQPMLATIAMTVHQRSRHPVYKSAHSAGNRVRAIAVSPLLCGESLGNPRQSTDWPPCPS